MFASPILIATALGGSPEQDLRDLPAHRPVARAGRNPETPRRVAAARRNPGAQGHSGREGGGHLRLRAAPERGRRRAVRLRQVEPAPRRRGDAAGGGTGDQEARRQGLARRRPHRLQGRRGLQHAAVGSARRDGARLDGGPGPDRGRHADPGASARRSRRRPNTTADGRDDPEGRQKNRRVEVVFDTCR